METNINEAAYMAERYPKSMGVLSQASANLRPNTADPKTFSRIKGLKRQST